jgi:hypothetical protein
MRPAKLNSVPGAAAWAAPAALAAKSEASSEVSLPDASLNHAVIAAS